MAEKKMTPEEYHRLRDEQDNFPGVCVVDGHVVYDGFAEKYGLPWMTDEELPIELQRKNIDHPEDEDIDYPATEGIPPPAKPRP